MRSWPIRVLALSLAFSAPLAGAADWPSYNGDADATNFSPLNSINKTNVNKLGLAWSMELDEKGVVEGTPLAVNGVIYGTGPHSVLYAVDARTGKRLWKYDAEVWKHNPAKMRIGAGISRGLAYENGRVFLGTQDGRLIGLDAASGKEIWSVQTVPAEGKKTITGAPRAFKGKVIVGFAFSEADARGYVTAYDAATGRQIWRFYTVPGSPEENKGDPVMERAAKTWSGPFWKRGGGGAVWDSITYDAELNRIYFGTSNASPYNPRLRSPAGGDNLFTASIVALDADSGKYLWHYQVNPNDAWDFDAANQITLADLKIKGKLRKVLMQAPKDGFFYVIDRMTGKLISAGKIGKVNWAERIDVKTGRPVDVKDMRYETGPVVVWPGVAGIHNWMSMSYNPLDGLVYIPTLQLASRFTVRDDKNEEDRMGVQSTMEIVDPEDGKGTLLAWDPVQQKARWTVHQDHLWNGGALSTAGDLVFQGTPDGYLSAYDGSTGALLWRFNAGDGILGSPISYSIGDEQYVAVQTGYGASSGSDGSSTVVDWRYGMHPRLLLSFALDGTAVLPPPPPVEARRIVDDPALVIAEADVAPGEKLFTRNCVMCHGLVMATVGAPAPDLRKSQIALRREDLWHVLHDGALLPNGMPQFPELTETEVGQIYAYIRTRARQALASAPDENRTPAAPGADASRPLKK